ncbi:MAG: PEP-CTERM sorting domain-containing protein [Burkholderiaceae bacterium]|nr:PEP-CTERM sorting domain-containing protein [Burkholderiaceae bacterium]
MRTTYFVAAMLSALTMPAVGSTGASVDVSNFAYTLKAIDGASGTVPSLAWQPDWSMHASASIATPEWSTRYYGVGEFKWGSGDKAWVQNWNYSDWQSGSGTAPQTSLQMAFTYGASQLYTTGTGTQLLSANQEVGTGQLGRGSGSTRQHFILGAGSEVTFSIRVSGFAYGTAYAGDWVTPRDTDLHPLTPHSMASFSAGISIQDGGDWVTERYGNFGVNFWSRHDLAYTRRAESELVQVTVTNSSAEQKTYVLSLFADVDAREAMAPVPEPSTYGLMAMGLLTLGVVRRRQRSNRA